MLKNKRLGIKVTVHSIYGISAGSFAAWPVLLASSFPVIMGDYGLR
jgi:hypothetical protein